MHPELETELAGLRRAVQQIQGAATLAAQFAAGPVLSAMVEEAVTRSVARADSPFVDRAGAAARWFKSESEIDRAAAAGVLPRHHAGGRTLFLKTEGDAAILEGRWELERRKAA